MRHDPVLARAIHALTHPVTIAAIAVMLLNDHVLKDLFGPSWWTGKLSDLAWVVFAAPALAIVLALLVRVRFSGRDATVAGLAYGGVGVAYALFNLWQPAHDAFSAALGVLEGSPVAMARDATDALVIPPALALGRWTWRRASTTMPSLAPGALVVMAAALATVATSSDPVDIGIACLSEADGVVIARAASVSSPIDDDSLVLDVRSFVSRDGGLSWSESPESGRCEVRTRGSVDDGDVSYRWVAGEKLERSSDQGRTWDTEAGLVERFGTFWLTQRTWQVETGYDAAGFSWRFPAYQAGPFDLLVHRPTGHVIAAMGHDGVLVRTATGWRPAGVGMYRAGDTSLSSKLALMNYLWFLAATAVLLVMGTALVEPVERRSGRGGVGAALIVGWVGWVTISFLLVLAEGSATTGVYVFVLGVPWIVVWIAIRLRPLVRRGFQIVLSTFVGIFLFGFLGDVWGITFLTGDLFWILLFLPVYAAELFPTARRAGPQGWLLLLVIVVGPAMTTAVPYILWAAGAVATQLTATLLAVGLTMALAFALRTWARRLLALDMAEG